MDIEPVKFRLRWSWKHQLWFQIEDLETELLIAQIEREDTIIDGYRTDH
jgi:hypothetical protein